MANATPTKSADIYYLLVCTHDCVLFINPQCRKENPRQIQICVSVVLKQGLTYAVKASHQWPDADQVCQRERQRQTQRERERVLVFYAQSTIMIVPEREREKGHPSCK